MSPAVFDTSNEPYLGRKQLHAFDRLICACLDLNSKCAASTHGRDLSSLQEAMCILVPQTISLALSIRELIRQGYLFGAKVLVRPLTERAVTILYLFHNPEGLRIWEAGWNYGERPSLQRMVEYLDDRFLKEDGLSVKGFTRNLNSATHGDPLSARWNVVLRDGVPVFLPSKNLESPTLADEICAETIPWLASTTGVMTAVFNENESDLVV